ncbi:hypothetical protein FV139_03150 [Parahaliea maris]|uniref:Uncharacterized protein n=2 Tax=Parahaliea maris TaxID=2716870 RepID=A0A5C9A7S2_9GAMM|nr:hypothetical protein FV139_03150 [Parahaliea maris]
MTSANTSIKPVRPWIYPLEGDTWERIARREFPSRPLEEAVADLQSWNLYLVFRPAPAGMTRSDIVFTGPPAA